MNTENHSRKTSPIVTVLLLSIVLLASSYFIFKNAKPPSSQVSQFNNAGSPNSLTKDSARPQIAESIALEVEEILNSSNQDITESDAQLLSARTKDLAQKIEMAKKQTERDSDRVSRSFSSSPLSQSPLSSPAPSATPPATPSPSASPKRALSDEQIFNILYPHYYTSYLKRMQDLMVNDNYLSVTQKKSFQTEKEIFSFLDDSLDFWVKTGAIKAGEKKQYTQGLAIVKSLLQSERAYYESLSPLAILGLKLTQPFKQLASFLIKPAAAVGGCFRIGAPTPGGANLWAPCCDCDVEEVPIGCLNSVCTVGAAIYDEMTGICGCG